MNPIGVTTHTVRLVKKGERHIVKIQLETEIRDKDRLRVLIRETLRVASLAEHGVRFMGEANVTKAIQEMDDMDAAYALKWTPTVDTR